MMCSPLFQSDEHGRDAELEGKCLGFLKVLRFPFPVPVWVSTSLARAFFARFWVFCASEKKILSAIFFFYRSRFDSELDLWAGLANVVK